MKTRFLLVLLTLISFGINAQETNLNKLMQQRNEYYFSFNLNGNDDLYAIAHTISVDHVDGNTVIAYANNDEFNRFQKLGYDVTLLTPPSMVEKAVMWDGSNRAEYDWDTYPTYQAYEDMMFQFATDHPDKCEIITLGTLPSNRKIMIAHINNGTAQGKPKFLYTSTIHGDETTGWILMLRLIDYLLENPTLPECQNVLNNIDLYICPNANPDGTYHGGNNNVNGATRANANGIDMNRNYADPHEGPHPDGYAYQLETQWFMQFAQENHFVMGANYHGGAEVMNYPWDNTHTLHADDAWYQLISHEYADLTHQVSSSYMTDYNNGITNGASWYMIGGGRQDYMNGYAQCRELTIECSNTKLPSASQLPSFWNINKNSIFAFMNQCLNGIYGTVTDLGTGLPIEATITLVDHDDEYSIVSTQLPGGDYHRPVKAGTYNARFTANGYQSYETSVTVADNNNVELNVQLAQLEGLTADFTSNTTAVSVGGTVQFTDASWGAQINSWAWEFEGGTPATSTERNPSVTYNEEGSYGVRLTVTKATGETDTKYVPSYISVVEAYNMQSTTITTCDAMFYDDGGPDSDYSHNQNSTMTFRPATEGAMLEVTFNEFNTENNWDKLYIYDGADATSTLIGEFTGHNGPGTVTATNAQGALTFRFNSDSSVANSGWKAHVYCTGISYDPLEVTAEADPAVINEGEVSRLLATATGGTGIYTYSWVPAESLDNPYIANPVASPEQPTEYIVTVTDSEGNSAEATVFVDIRNVNTSEYGLGLVKVYPNPSDGHFRVEGLQGSTTYSIMNSLGQVVLEGQCHGNLDLNTDLPKGVYFLRLDSASNTTTLKIAVK
ncbi:MAG: T9SS type A sorting domain-containing protein [Bacteroidales bacterium]|nr:T9SS type A sorting domain-containing protein [Bacteroidales bacterium]